MFWLLLTLLGIVLVGWLGRRWLPERPAAPRAAPGPAPELLPPRPIGDELDLHGVPPDAVAELVDAFLDEALRRRMASVCIVHGKGIGVQRARVRARVRARLARHHGVRSFGDAPLPRGWGATVVELDLSGSAVDPAPTSD